jgi:hypothetical protein
VHGSVWKFLGQCWPATPMALAHTLRQGVPQGSSMDAQQIEDWLRVDPDGRQDFITALRDCLPAASKRIIPFNQVVRRLLDDL